MKKERKFKKYMEGYLVSKALFQRDDKISQDREMIHEVIHSWMSGYRDWRKRINEITNEVYR